MATDAPLILSASSTKEWLSCGYKYLLSSVWRVPGEPNMAMAIGTATHAGIEAHHKGAGDPRAALVTALKAETDLMAEPFSESVSVALRDAFAMFDMYLDRVAPTFHPSLIEASFIIDIDGILFSGQIDAADEDVRDIKTTANLTKFQAANHGFQMTGYSLGYEFLTGHKPRRLLLDVLTRNGKYKQVEVQPDYRDFMDTLTIASQGIIAREFVPTGVANGVCKWCPYYQRECRYGVVD